MDEGLQNSKNIDLLAQEAIEAAISLNWEKAAKINKKILDLSEKDVEALNRLARARFCLGNKEGAEKTYKKVLGIDPYNIIARKNLDKLTRSNGNPVGPNGTNGPKDQNGKTSPNLANLFIFEPGKTKLVNLLNLAPPAILASLNCGDQVLINPKNHSVTISSLNKVYLGALPDDLAHRLIAFIAGGNKYDCYVKNANLKSLTVFIREITRSAKFASQPSFQYKFVHRDEQEMAFY
ncbi:hypothetical protein HYS90_02230 [Candidatus Curtissbacteria bacterium]|nr:hypothetical protein [Candidatus Curtissbacteria bacterium]